MVFYALGAFLDAFVDEQGFSTGLAGGRCGRLLAGIRSVRVLHGQAGQSLRCSLGDHGGHGGQHRRHGAARTSAIWLADVRCDDHLRHRLRTLRSGADHHIGDALVRASPLGGDGDCVHRIVARRHHPAAAVEQTHRNRIADLLGAPIRRCVLRPAADLDVVLHSSMAQRRGTAARRSAAGQRFGRSPQFSAAGDVLPAGHPHTVLRLHCHRIRTGDEQPGRGHPAHVQAHRGQARFKTLLLRPRLRCWPEPAWWPESAAGSQR